VARRFDLLAGVTDGVAGVHGGASGDASIEGGLAELVAKLVGDLG
jgi:hypothetical protein